MNPNNPLTQYFRQPIIYIRLPSGGKYYPQGTIEVPANGEFPVYAMTAVDEMRYRTPDALFNGQAVVDVIQSCVPSIKDGWVVPSTDLDTILTAIRIASYGHNMEFATVCPKCNHTEDRTLDLRTVIDSLRPTDYTQPLVYGDMTIYFRPMTYKNITDNNRAQYEEQRLISQIPTATEENIDQALNFDYGKIFNRITEITVKALSQSIASIKTPNALVLEQEYILDLLMNCDRKLFNQVRDYIIKSKETSELKPLHIQCSECNNEYDQTVTLDMTTFFADAS